ncbi:MAG: sigma 54-interacting transcriptional regulator [Perlabentimonas sp.]
MPTYSERLLTTNEIQSRLSSNQWLINTAIPLMQNVAKLINFKEFALLLTDTEGCVLHIQSNEPLLSKLKDFSIFPGGIPKLSNSIGVCLSKIVKEEASVEFVEERNKGKGINGLVCWGTPLSTQSHGFVGVLAAIATSEFNSMYAQPILLQNAQCIENELVRLEQHQHLKRIKNFQLSFFTKQLQANIIVDGAGKILLANDSACSLFEVEREELESKSIKKYIKEWDDLSQLSTKRQEVVNVEVSFDNAASEGEYLLSLKVIKFLSGRVDEISCTITSAKDVIAQANRYFGNVAAKSFNSIVAVSPILKRLVKEAKAFANNSEPLLILGERYTGKHTFAQAIHNEGNSYSHSFVRLDLSNLTAQQIDEELWGYTKTYKPYLNRPAKPGAFEFAHGGTLFINEISLLNNSNQAKLLDVIKSSKVHRLGANKPTEVNVRIIAASTCSLESKITNGEFSKDLFYALSKNSLRLPPLRERRLDIPPLLKHFMSIISQKLGRKPFEIPKKFILILKRYEWPNNFQEMKELLEIIIRTKGEMFKNFKNERRFKTKHLYLDKQRALEHIIPVDEHEKMLIEDAYNVMEGSISSMSRRLGVSRNTLYLKLKRYGMIEEQAGLTDSN